MGSSFEQEEGQLAVSLLAPLHVMCDEDSQFPLTGLNAWEFKIVWVSSSDRPLAGGAELSWAAFDSLGIT